MQTFLPYPDYVKCAQSLDNKRLGKQRVEAMQIINILDGKQASAGWKKHPAVTMWAGYNSSLKHYCNCCIDEWIKRGFKNTIAKYDVNANLTFWQRIISFIKKVFGYKIQDRIRNPWFIGNEDFHRAMRSRLIEKDENFYLPKFPNDKGFNDSKYFWPVTETKTFRII